MVKDERPYRLDPRAVAARGAFYGQEGYEKLSRFIQLYVGTIDGEATGYTLADAMRVVDAFTDDQFNAYIGWIH